MEDRVFAAALAGLLHDVGKFMQRAGMGLRERWNTQSKNDFGYPDALASSIFIQRYVPKIWLHSVDSAAYYHQPKDEIGYLIQVANWLTTVEHQTDEVEWENFDEAQLTAILSRVSLAAGASSKPYCHQLSALDLENDAVYPIELGPNCAPKTSYKDLWQQMTDELDLWKASMGERWETQAPGAYFVTLLAIIRKYMWCIPAATLRQTGPQKQIPLDVSLFEHLRLVSAIAACLSAGDIDSARVRNNPQEPVALLIRGDLSGIQNFIFRITRPESETEHVAKRLRGRSFYLTMLVEIVVDWILRQIGIPITCALFVGGGRFDLLLPVNAGARLTELTAKLEDWLMESFQGELGLQTAICELHSADLEDMRPVYRQLDVKIESSKRQKWLRQLNAPGFFDPQPAIWHVCRVCQLTPLPEPGICPLCKQHEQIGKHLPHTTALAFFYSDQMPSQLPADQVITFSDSPFHTRIALMKEADGLLTWHETEQPDVIFQLNSTIGFIKPGVGSSFRFLANEAPLARQWLRMSEMPPIEEGDVLHFEALAELSTGAKRLGVLKADVDYLGLVMGDGLTEDRPGGLRPTLSRISALSGVLDLFFAGCLNQICRKAFTIWQQESKHEWVVEGAVDNVFYIMYSGGDDLFIVGPWDAVLILADTLHKEFKRFTGQNPSMTISAGFVPVKPRFPVQKFAEYVDAAEKAAKNGGRNAISLFGQVILWEGTPDSLASLYALSQELCNEIEAKRLPRGLLADLGQVYRQHRQEKNKKLNPMWNPRLYYSLSRRLSPETFQQIGRHLIDAMKEGKILVPVSITSLKTRKE